MAALDATAAAAAAGPAAAGHPVLEDEVLARVRGFVDATPNKVALRWLDAKLNVAQSVTYAELWARSTGIANSIAKLHNLDAARGAIICYPFGLDFIPAFLALLRLGIPVVSVYPPNPKKLDGDLKKLERFVESSGATLALTTKKYKRFISASKLAGKVWPSQLSKWLVTDTIAPAKTETFTPYTNDVAFIQYTSGSTGVPKGVIITRANMAHQLLCCHTVFGCGPDGRGINWLPQYHDYGLLGGFWLSLYTGASSICFSPLDFIRNPLMWPAAIEKFKGTHIAGPNFAYALVIKRVKASSRTFDLSSIRYLDLAAEPIDPETLGDLESVLKVSREVMHGTYGMAETTLWVAGMPYRLDAETGLVSCGSIPKSRELGVLIKVVDRETGVEADDGQVGEAWIQSPSLSRGYLGQEELTRQAFHATIPGHDGSWYRTGDLGFVRADVLYVCGRLKDLIIINGKNIYPSDMERFVEKRYDWIRPGSSVAFQWAATEAALLVEMRPHANSKGAVRVEEVKKAVEFEFELALEVLAVYPKGTLPKTTSGKIRRAETQRLHKQGMLPTPVLQTHTDTRPPPATFDELLEKYGVADPSVSLVDNGVDSMRLVQLMREAQDLFGLDIPTEALGSLPAKDLPGLARSPQQEAEARRWLAKGLDVPYPTPDRPIQSRLLRGVIELGIVLLTVAVFIASAIPAAYVHQGLIDRIVERHPEHTSPWLVTFEHGPGLLLSVTPITFLLTLTAAMIAIKWLVVGRYRAGQHCLYGWWFYRFLLVERIVDVWEGFVGSFLLETPLLCLVYRLMGARVAWSCRLGTFVRQHDLMTAGAHSSVNGLFLCRILDARGLSLAAMEVPAGQEVPGGGLVYPGLDVPLKEVERRSAADVVLRLLFVPALIGVFMGSQYAGSFVAQQAGLEDRAGRVAVSLVSGVVVLGLLSIALVRLRLLLWSADRLASQAFRILEPWIKFSAVSTAWHRLNGAKIGAGSQLNSFRNLAPSKASLVTIGRGCTASNALLKPERGRPIDIGDNSFLGAMTIVRGNVQLGKNSGVIPMCDLEDEVVQSERLRVSEDVSLPARVETDSRPPSCLRCTELCFMAVRIVFHWIPLAASIGATIYVGELMADSDVVERSPLAVQVVLVMGSVLAAAWVTMLVLYLALARIGVPSQASTIPLNTFRAFLYVSHMSQNTLMETYVWRFMSGTFLLNLHYRLAGARLSLFDTLLFECYVHDPVLVVLEEGVVVDRGSHVNGHRMEYSSFRFDRSRLYRGASLHPMVLLMGGDELEADATLAGRSCFLGPRKAPQHRGAHQPGTESSSSRPVVAAGDSAMLGESPGVHRQVYAGHPAHAIVRPREQGASVPVDLAAATLSPGLESESRLTLV